jgi:WD40 repeat protein
MSTRHTPAPERAKEQLKSVEPQRLEFEIVPPKASIRVLGAPENVVREFERRGKLPIGLYRLEISKRGFKTKVEEIEVNEGPNVLRAVLEPLRARLFVNTDPHKTRITAIKKDSTIVRKHQSGMFLEWGDYDVEVSSSGFETIKFGVSIRSRDLIAAVSLDREDKTVGAGAARSLHVEYKFPGVYETAVAFTAQGDVRAALASDKKVEIWDVEKHRLLQTIPADNFVRALGFTPDAEVLAVTINESPIIQLWKVGNSRPLQAISSGYKDIHYLTFSPDGSKLASSDPSTVKIWHVESGRLLHKLDCEVNPVNPPEVAFNGDGSRVAVICHGTIRLYEIKSGDLIRIFEKDGCCDFVSLAYSSDGQSAVAGSGDGRVESWNVNTGERGIVYGKYIGGGVGPYLVAFSPDMRTLVSGYLGGWVDIWDVESAEKRGFLIGHDDAVRAIAFSPDGRTVATASTDGSVRLWDITGGNGAVQGK